MQSSGPATEGGRLDWKQLIVSVIIHVRNGWHQNTKKKKKKSTRNSHSPHFSYSDGFISQIWWHLSVLPLPLRTKQTLVWPTWPYVVWPPCLFSLFPLILSSLVQLPWLAVYHASPTRGLYMFSQPGMFFFSSPRSPSCFKISASVDPLLDQTFIVLSEHLAPPLSCLCHSCNLLLILWLFDSYVCWKKKQTNNRPKWSHYC